MGVPVLVVITSYAYRVSSRNSIPLNYSCLHFKHHINRFCGHNSCRKFPVGGIGDVRMDIHHSTIVNPYKIKRDQHTLHPERISVRLSKYE